MCVCVRAFRAFPPALWLAKRKNLLKRNIRNTERDSSRQNLSRNHVSGVHRGLTDNMQTILPSLNTIWDHDLKDPVDKPTCLLAQQGFALGAVHSN